MSSSKSEDKSILANNLAENRLQNLVISIDKIKYFLSQAGLSPKNPPPPLLLMQPSEVFESLWGHISRKIRNPKYLAKQKKPKSFIEDLILTLSAIQNMPEIDNFIKLIILLNQDMQKLAKNDTRKALLIIRFLCLKISHTLRTLAHKIDDTTCETRGFHYHGLADILYFQAFTHCYFKAYEYPEVRSKPVEVRTCEVSNQKIYCSRASNDLATDGRTLYMEEKVYKPTFIWAQMMYWFKQMSQNQDTVLASDKRGVISYPNLVDSFKKNRMGYPFNKNGKV